ncbi:nucleolar protein 12-domain-containing protein [Biscogniauxia marginata]|nr:nucleolar protein 12-domain-containing protein [Biscogniauxia marginata]
MFARPRPKKNVLPPAPRKRKGQHAVEEIKFDDEARTDYLTGFHKRKLQRAKQAQEQAAQKARQDKIEFRKQANCYSQLREDRKRQAEEHVQHVNAMLKEAQQAGYIDGDGDGDSGEDSGDAAAATADEWDGFQDAPAQEDNVDHEEEYIDEERYTTVTVESVSVSKEGLTSTRPEEEEPDEEGREAAASRDTRPAGGRKEKTHPPKKKKPKFRYETKVERRITQRKQKASNKRRPTG